MSGDHAELVAELRALAETVLDRLDPVLRKAAAGEAGSGSGSSCSWCPLCALAALIRGEQHDLVTLFAGQAAVLLTAVREVLDAHESGASADGAAPDPSGRTPAAPDGAGEPGAGFVPIDVTIRG